MKKLINMLLSNTAFTLLVVIVCVVACLFTGCAESPSAETPEATTDYYEYQDPYTSDVDMWRMVYQEQKIYIYVNTLDNSVWVSFHGNNIVPYTIDGKTVYWQGTLKDTFQKPIAE